MSKIKAYLDQDYETLKAEAKNSGELFVDHKFPANYSSIFRFKNFPSPIIWKRPHEIVNNPKFIVNKVEPNDLVQGIIGNCWWLAAAACVLNSQDMIERTIPLNQTFDPPEYCGIFHFRFWINGEWVDVVVDDYLPVYEFGDGLCFCYNKVEKNEMYGSLLEKAYAKLNFCYEFLGRGHVEDALVDLTGGIIESSRIIEIRQNSNLVDNLWETLFKAKSYRSLFVCFIDSSTNDKTRLPNGLVCRHAYSILDIFEIIKKNGIFNQLREIKSEKPTEDSIKLLRIRDPWGTKDAYIGLWNKNGNGWQQVGDNAKEIFVPDNQDDGQFLISYDDFVKEFDFLQMCHVNVNGFNNEQNINEDLRWKLVTFRGEWIVGENAGGLDNDLFWKNPQHKITIDDSKEKFTIIISLLQLGIANKKLQNGNIPTAYEPIGFFVYSIIDKEAKPDQNERYSKDNLKYYSARKIFLPSKQNSMRFDIVPGDYVVIPLLYEKNIPGSYVLRVYVESHKHFNDSNQIDQDINEPLTLEIGDKDNVSRACILM